MPATKKKGLTDRQFNRLHLLLTLLVSLLAILVPAAVTITATYVTRSDKHESTTNRMQDEDVSKYNTLSSQIESLTDLFFSTQDQIQMIKVDSELAVLSQEQSNIMERYGLDFKSAWPPKYVPDTSDNVHRTYLHDKYGIGNQAGAGSWSPAGVLLLVVLAVAVFGGLVYLVYQVVRRVLLAFYIVEPPQQRD